MQLNVSSPIPLCCLLPLMPARVVCILWVIWCIWYISQIKQLWCSRLSFQFGGVCLQGLSPDHIHRSCLYSCSAAICEGTMDWVGIHIPRGHQVVPTAKGNWPMGANLIQSTAHTNLESSGLTASFHWLASTELHQVQLVSQPVIKSWSSEHARFKGKDVLLSY